MSEEAISVFLSYARNDLDMLNELNKHLAGLKRTNKIKTWHDGDIAAGMERKPAIQHQLNTADIIILLISADFIASDYCYCDELQQAIRRHDAGDACVIPVILKPCLWNIPEIPFSKLNVLPENARAIKQWEDQAEAFTNVAKHISSAVAGLKGRKREKARAVQNTPSILTHFNGIDEISFKQVRENCRQKILEHHSQIRLLSGEEIGVDQLYVDVWLLEKPERRYFNTQKSLLESFEIEQDRLAMSQRIKRRPGFEIANSTSKLVILGKPGSGKTTFLKHLAVDWCNGKFQSDQVTILIELRRIRKQTWNFIDTIGNELELQEDAVLDLLQQGKLLVLMDGLDEVPTGKLRQNVQTQVKQVSRKYSTKNKFILTCRTQIMSQIPSSFTSVEVARFNPKQVKQFVQNWLMASGKFKNEVTKEWEKIEYFLDSQPDFRELTETPVLLSLICLIWQDSGTIPTNKNNLYQRGISWLLSRWNDRKEIEGWEFGTNTYRNLSIEDKEALLTEIAAHKFENPKNFVLFTQDELVKHITRKLQLTNKRDAIAALKSIEAQHGLLIERADELWSFSHLTFQEYFTVQWLSQIPSQQLTRKIYNRHWQRAIKQLIKSQQPADRLLRLIRKAVDKSIAEETIIQSFLGWLCQKSDSLQFNNRQPHLIRTFYGSLVPKSSFNFDLYSFDFEIETFDSEPEWFYMLQGINPSSLDLFIHDFLPNRREVRLGIDLICALNLYLDRHLFKILGLAKSLTRTLNYDRLFTLDRANALTRALELKRSLNEVITCSRHLKVSPDVTISLRELKEKSSMSNTSKEISRWWSSNGDQWIQQLRWVMQECRNVGHDWQFSHEQQQQLKDYYEANKFLIDLTKIKGAITEECRSEIDDGLLLPWTEFQRRQPHIYGDL